MTAAPKTINDDPKTLFALLVGCVTTVVVWAPPPKTGNPALIKTTQRPALQMWLDGHWEDVVHKIGVVQPPFWQINPSEHWRSFCVLRG